MIPFSNVFFRIFWNNVKTSCQPKILQINTNNTLCLGHFPFNKYSSLKFPKFYVPNETDTPVLQTRPKPPHIWLLYCHVVNKIQKNRSGDNKFEKWKGTFQSNQKEQSKGTTLIFWPGQTKMIHSIWLPLKLQEFWAEWKAYVPLVSKFPNLFSINAILHEHFLRGMLKEGGDSWTPLSGRY